MRRFDNTRLWEALKTSANLPTALSLRLNTALEEFRDDLRDYCKEERDIAERTRTLNSTRSELATLEPLFGKSKKK